MTAGNHRVEVASFSSVADTRLGPRGKEGCGVAGTMRWPAFATRDDSKANPAQPGLHLFGGCTVQWFDRHQRHAERHQFHRDPFNPRQHPQLIHRRADTPRAGQSPHPVRCPSCRGILTSTHPIGHIVNLGASQPRWRADRVKIEARSPASAPAPRSAAARMPQVPGPIRLVDGRAHR